MTILATLACDLSGAGWIEVELGSAFDDFVMVYRLGPDL